MISVNISEPTRKNVREYHSYRRKHSHSNSAPANSYKIIHNVDTNRIVREFKRIHNVPTIRSDQQPIYWVRNDIAQVCYSVLEPFNFALEL